MSRRWLALALAGLLAVAAPAQAPADFLDAYDRGLAALERGDPAAAAELFRSAIAERPDETAQVLRRLRFRPYLPHYQLGLALFALGDCPGALAAWTESDRQGVVQKRGDYVLLRERTAICLDRLSAAADTGRAVARAEAVIAGAEGAAQMLAELAADPDLGPLWAAPWEDESSPAARAAEVERLLATSRARLAEAERGEGAAAVAAAEGATEAAAEARRLAGELRADVEPRLRSLRQTKDRRQARIDALRAEAQQLLFTVGATDPRSERIGRARERLEELLATSRSAAGAPLGEVARLEAAIADALGDLRAAAMPPPEPLLDAARSWLAGDPAAVVAALDGHDWRQPRTRAHAALLLAAARFSLARRRPGGDPDELAAARRAAATCRAAAPDLEPLEAAFSPAFREWFAGVR